ncbi:hypothetical protein AHAS_Ahas15G0255900 [Arachis hypogaea]
MYLYGYVGGTGAGTGEESTPADIGKGHNLRADPPRCSTNRYTLSTFKRVAKKCKNLVKYVKWAMKK